MLISPVKKLVSISIIALSNSYSVAVEHRTVLSPVYTIDKIYRSMEGPTSTQQVYLLDTPKPELLWITGFRTEMMAEDGQTASRPEFMCHVNLDFNPEKHREALGLGKVTSSRLLTLSQGELTTRFPPGFGMPILSNEPLSLTTQVLNLNDPNLKAKVRHKVTFEFVRDADLMQPMKPLFNVAPFVMAPLDESKPADMAAIPTMKGDSCLPGMHMPAQGQQHAPNASGGSLYKDDQGRTLSGHWVVPPGRSVVRTNVTKWMNLPFDTTLHFAAVHLHPYAESLELRDLSADKTVFKSHARSPKNRIGLDAVENYSSEVGTPLYKDHQYELTSVYNNPTKTNSDSMAVMLLFLLDKEFKKPTPDFLLKNAANDHPIIPAPVSQPAVKPLDALLSKKLAQARIVMRTTLGDLVLSLDPQAAPQTVQQFMALAKADAYAGVPALYIQPGFLMQWGQVQDRALPLTTDQQALVKKLPLEVGTLLHRRGVLSMARNPEDSNSSESSFCILFGDASHLDGHYTAFGKVEAGEQVLAALESASKDASGKPLSRLEIKHMDIVDSPKLLGKLKIQKIIPSAIPSPATLTPAFSTPVATANLDLTPAPERLVLTTEAGKMSFRLYPKVAPQTVAAITRWAKAGIFDTTHFGRLEPGFVLQLSLAQDRLTPLTAAQKELLGKIPAEFSTLKHRRGVLSMAREDNDVNSAQTSFSILLGDAPHLDGHYTIFGEIETGQDVLSGLEKTPITGRNTPAHRLTVQKAEMAPLAMTSEENPTPLCHATENEFGGKAGSAVGTSTKPKPFGPYIPITPENLVTKEFEREDGETVKQVTFKNILMDRMYPSMLGPWTRTYLPMNDASKSSAMWITGYRAQVLEDGTHKASQEFMCHTKMDTVSVPGTSAAPEARSFFVISQGQEEVRFPNGYALRIPNSSDRRIDLNVMVLNNNAPEIHKYLDFQATISYLDDAAAMKNGTKALSLVSGSVFCPIRADAARPGESICEPATDEGPQTMRTGHWLVPPGRHTYQAPANFALASDTAVHYIMMHVHPYAESFALRDGTTGQTCWKGNVHNVPAQALIRSTDYYSSAKGLPLLKDHRYELEVVYNNSTSHPVDAMASLWVYTDDQS